MLLYKSIGLESSFLQAAYCKKELYFNHHFISKIRRLSVKPDLLKKNDIYD